MITVLNCVHTVPFPDYDEKHTIHELRTGYWNVFFTFQINLLKYYSMHFELTYRQPAQNGVMTDQLCRAVFCIHLSIMSMQIAITIT